MTQQDDITQRVLTDDEIQALWDEACKDSPQSPGWNRHIRFAHALLSKLRAPVADERAAFEEWLLTSNVKAHIGYSTDELTLARAAWDERGRRAGLASARVANERQSDIAAALQDSAYCAGLQRGFMLGYHNDNDGLRQALESRDGYVKTIKDARAALASAPVAGEAVAWKIYDAALGKHILTENSKVADMLLRAGGNTVRPLVYGDAAPQASAEDVRNAALEAAVGVVAGEWEENVSLLTIAKAIRALKQPQADKDGGQQRAGDVDVDRLMTAAKGMTRLYSYVWDRTDGCLVVFPENVRAFDAAFDALRMATGEAVDDAPQAEQGERDD